MLFIILGHLHCHNLCQYLCIVDSGSTQRNIIPLFPDFGDTNQQNPSTSHPIIITPDARLGDIDGTVFHSMQKLLKINSEVQLCFF